MPLSPELARILGLAPPTLLAAPPVIGMRYASHVRVTPEHVEIVWCYGHFVRRERVPRGLIDRVDVPERGGEGGALVRPLVRGRGCVCVPVGDPDGFMEALGAVTRHGQSLRAS